MHSRFEYRDDSPPKGSSTLRQDDYYHKKILRYEADIRRLTDQLNLALIKARRFQELQEKYEGLIRQNSTLSQQNQNLVLQLNERKREIDLIRCQYEENSLRDQQRLAHASDIRGNLERQIQMLKKTNNQSCLLYQEHINKLQKLIEERTREGEDVALRLQKFRSQAQYELLRNQDQKIKLKSEIDRTEYEKVVELDHLRQKLASSTDIELDNIKKAHYSQIAILQQEINKFRNLSLLKDSQIERMIEQNSNMKRAYQTQILNLRKETDLLRQKMLLQERKHHEELDSLRLKYSSLHSNDTDNLKISHSNQSKFLLGQLDKLKSLVCEKTLEIQNLHREGNQHRLFYDKQLSNYQAELQLQKNKFKAFQTQKARQIQSLSSQLQFQSQKNKTLQNNSGMATSFLQKKLKETSDQLSAKNDQVHNLNNLINQRKKQFQDFQNKSKSQMNRMKSQTEMALKSKNRQLQVLNSASGSDKQKINEQLLRIQEDKQDLINELGQLRQRVVQKDNQINSLNRKLGLTSQSLKRCQVQLNGQKKAAAQRQAGCNAQLKQLSQNVTKTSISLQNQLKRTYQARIRALNQDKQHLQNLLLESKRRVEGVVKSFQDFKKERSSQGSRRSTAGPLQCSSQNYLEVLVSVARQALLPIL